ncbi:phosphoglycerate kinase [Nematocida ausubeli]|nr:phosphoglycerate kinase [Nematocida ausubeli]
MKAWTHEVYSGKKTLGDVDIEGKRVFLRVDYNVPIQDGLVSDKAKIQKSLGTIEYLLRKNVQSIVIASHLGRPGLDADPHNPTDATMMPVLEALNACLDRAEMPIQFEFEYMANRKTQKKWVMVQNLRTLAVEKDPTDSESKELFDAFIEKNCDLMVNDAFAVLHRDDYSVTQIKLEKIAGLLLDSEMQGVSLILGKARPTQEHSPITSLSRRDKEKFLRVGKDPKNFQTQEQKPIDLLIIGGCKLQDKIKMVKNLAKITSNIFLGGLLSVPLLEHNPSPDVEDLIGCVIFEQVSLFYPVDYVLENLSVVSYKEAAGSASKIKDIGPMTEDMLTSLISQSASLFWNGTLGQAEIKEYAHGTDTALNAIMQRKQQLQKAETKSMLCAGGGDTCGYINISGHADAFDLILTGGGAALAALQGDVLPGVFALSERN